MASDYRPTNRFRIKREIEYLSDNLARHKDTLQQWMESMFSDDAGYWEDVPVVKVD